MNKQTPRKEASIDPSQWVDRYGDYLYRFALARVRNPDDAEEVVQEALAAALKNVDQFAGRTEERGWLVGILKLKIIDHFRAITRNPTHLDPESGDICDRLFDERGSWRKELRTVMKQSMDSVDRQEFWEILDHCLDTLPGRTAAVFTLRVMDEQPSHFICKELEISPTNYWVILHRARVQLSSCMKQHWFLNQSE